MQRLGLGIGVAALLTAAAAVAQDRVTPIEDATPVIPQITPLDAPTNLRPDTPLDAVPAPQRPAAPAAKAVKAVKKHAAATHLWTTASVTLRSGPSADSGVVDELSPGTAVSVTGKGTPEWTAVRVIGGETGFIRSTYLTRRAPSAPACDVPAIADAGGPVLAAGTVVRAVVSSYLRAGPGCDTHALDVLEAGSEVIITGPAGEWYAVTGQGWGRAFIHRRLVRPAE